MNQRGVIVRWIDNEKTTIGIGTVELLGCESDGAWMYALLRGSLPHAVFYDPIRVWIPSINNNQFTFLFYLYFRETRLSAESAR